MRQDADEGCQDITGESLLCCSAAPLLTWEGKALTAGIACQASPLRSKKLLRLTWLPSASDIATMYPRIPSDCSPLHFPSSSLFYKFSLSFFVSFISLGINVFVYEMFSHSKELTTFLTLKTRCFDLISRKFETFNEKKISGQ